MVVATYAISAARHKPSKTTERSTFQAPIPAARSATNSESEPMLGKPTMFELVLDHIGKVLPGLGEPPVAERKRDNRKNSEVGEARPVGRETIDQNSTVTSNQRREGIPLDDG